MAKLVYGLSQSLSRRCKTYTLCNVALTALTPTRTPFGPACPGRAAV